MEQQVTRNPIGWFEIYVTDMARARAFYEQVLSVELSPLGNPDDPAIQLMAFPSDMSRYGAGGALVRMEGFPVGQNSVIVYFSCTDCAVEESRVVAAGGRIQRPKFPIGEYGNVSLVVDTEGNLFGLHSMA